LGTVYRNLVFFQKQGVIKSVGVVNGQERFDRLTAPHSHFVCSRCGAVIDLHALKLDSGLDHIVSEQYKFKVERHELTFYGICQQCMQNKNDQEEVRA
jgi:Fur family peroxide stress response transcriptional regulator